MDAAYRQQLHAAVANATMWQDASSMEAIGEDPEAFSEEAVRDLWAAAPPRAHDGAHHVYVHVPFCKSVCTFCNYKRLRPSSPQLLDRYLERIETSLRTLGPGLSHLRFETLYLGGGTPTVLPAAKLDRLLSMLDASLHFVPGGRRVAEADPAVLGEARARVLARHGVHHVSMGVQTLDADVIRSHDRGAQDASLVARQVDHLRNAGIREFSFDLIVGLADTSAESVLADLDRLLTSLRPKWVDVYALTPTHRYVDLNFGGDFEAFHAFQRPILQEVHRRIGAVARRRGYAVRGSSGHSWSVERRFSLGELATGVALGAQGAARVLSRDLGDRPLTDVLRAAAGELGLHGRPSYTQLVSVQQRPLHLLGLGYSARSRIFGVASLTYQDPDDDPMAEGPAHYLGERHDLDDEARTYLLHMWRDGQGVDRRRFESLFGRSLDSMAGEALTRWRADGRLRELRGRVWLDLPPRREGLEALMWLYPTERLEDTLAARRGLVFRGDALRGAFHPFSVGGAICDGWMLASVAGPVVSLTHEDGSEARLRVVPDVRHTVGVVLRPASRRGGADAQRAVAALRKALAGQGASTWGREADSRPHEVHPAAVI